MKKVLEIPENVNIELKDRKVVVNGPKGQIQRDFNDPRYNRSVTIEREGSAIVIQSPSEKRKIKAMVGTINAHINNMCKGVVEGVEYRMKIFYSHFPITVEAKGGKVLIKNFLGEKSIRIGKIVGKTKVDVKKDEVILTGINIEEVGLTASNIERACRLSNRDRRIFFDGIYLVVN
ncbi:MAG: 50S ribosomal protein L6 [Candidatus Aenigmarchaeota archaeon]|nr:50S ribosomal protein L6 [Candidatus Aenigmarchaeota archaeon]